MTVPIPNGTFLLAFFAALVPYLSLIISKENKTSEFRRAWVDSLREEVAQLVAHANGIQGTLRRHMAATADAWTEARDDVVGLNRCVAMIRLRLNPTEPGPKKIASILDELSRHFAPNTLPDTERFNDIELRLLTETQILLKHEWKRVRNGEPFFSATRNIFLGLVVLTFIAAMYFAIKHFF